MDKQSRACSTLFTAPGRYDALIIFCVKIETFQPRFFSRIVLKSARVHIRQNPFSIMIYCISIITIVVQIDQKKFFVISTIDDQFLYLERLIELKVVYNKFA